VTVTADPRLLGGFDVAGHRWSLRGGDYQVAVGGSSADLALKGAAKVKARTIRP
jgi:beta-glucosidase